MRDLLNSIHVVRAISPVATAADNTAVVSEIIDRRGYDALTFLVALGAIPDADATFAVTMDDGDASNLSDAAAVTALAGTLALAGFTFADDNEVRKVGYLGSKRYVRLTVTPSANTGATLIGAIALLGRMSQSPSANPPI